MSLTSQFYDEQVLFCDSMHKRCITFLFIFSLHGTNIFQ
jgi:hypothetical protein